MDEWENTVPIGDETSKVTTFTANRLTQFTDKHFKPYFTETGLTEYLNTNGLMFLMQASWRGYQLEIKDLDIDKLGEEGNYYDFTV